MTTGIEASIDWDRVDPILRLALEEDVGSGDVTTEATVDAAQRGTGSIIAKKPCVVAGVPVAARLFHLLDPAVVLKPLFAEGRKATAGTVVCTLAGPYRSLLAGERTALNFLQRMCGIATLTARFVRAVRGTRCTVLDTRKTAPGLRVLDKYAVRAGGGTNHRMGLFDAVLLKENHIEAAGGIPGAIRKVREGRPEMRIEVEVRDMEELVLAAEDGADMILLDNMSMADVERAARLVGERIPLEVSGGVTLANVGKLAHTGVARVSVGALTHSAPAADLSMIILRTREETSR